MCFLFVSPFLALSPLSGDEHHPQNKKAFLLIRTSMKCAIREIIHTLMPIEPPSSGQRSLKKFLHPFTALSDHWLVPHTHAHTHTHTHATRNKKQATRINEYPTGNRKDSEPWWLTPTSDQWSLSKTRNKKENRRLWKDFLLPIPCQSWTKTTK